VRLPTSVDQVGSNGERLPVEAQTGSGGVAPILGLFYTHLADPWSLFGSATVSLPVAPRFDEAPGPSMRAQVALQYRFDRWITVRGGVAMRLDAPASAGGRSEPGTDDFALFVSPNLLWSPVSDLILVFGLRVPVAQISQQGRAEGLYATTSVIVDL
jgi:hypothetical protein